MRPRLLIILFVLPLFSGLFGDLNSSEELVDRTQKQVIGSGNPLGWEWVEKDDEAGYVWIREVESLVDGTSYVSGVFRGGGVHVDSHYVLNSGAHDIFIGKRNFDNKWLWLTVIGGSGEEFVNDMEFDNNDDLLLVGTTDSSQLQVITSSSTVTHNNAGSRDGFVTHLNASTGTISWFNAIADTGHDNITGVSQASNGAITVCGWSTSSTLTIGSTSFSNSGLEDMFLAWYSASGVLQNSMMYGGSGQELLHDCKVDNNGKTIAVGEFSSSSLSLNQTTISHGGGTGSDSIVMRVSNQNGVEWVRMPIATAHDRATSVAVDSAGNIFVAGEHHYNGSNSNSITWGSIQISYGGDKSMVYVVKISNVGAIGWALRSYQSTSYHQNRQTLEPSLDLVGSHLGLSLITKGSSYINFRTGGGTYNNFYTGGSVWSSMIVGITNIGTMSNSNYRTHANTLVFDFDAVENTTSSNDYINAGWNNNPRTSSSYTTSTTFSMTSDAPGGFLVRTKWEVSTNSLGPTASSEIKSYIGISGLEEVIDMEPISSTRTAILIYSESQGLRFGQHTIGGTYDDKKLVLVVVDNNGNWISSDSLTFGRTRDQYQSWSSSADYNYRKMGINMDAAPNGTVWISLFWANSLFVPNVIQKTTSYEYGVISWTQNNGWDTYSRINFNTNHYIQNDIAVDGLGNVYVMGNCYSTLQVDGSTIRSFSSTYRTCIAMWNASSSSWDNGFGSNGYTSTLYSSSITGHPQGGAILYDKGGYWNSYSTGSNTNTDSGRGGLVRLYHNNMSAALLGTPSAHSNSNVIKSIDVNANGDIIVGGWFQGSISYPNCCSVNTGGGRDGMLVFWNNSSMSWDWAISLGGSSSDEIRSVRFVGNQSIVVVGEKTGVISVGLTTLAASGTGFVAVASTAGSWEWAQQPEGQSSVNAVSAISTQSILVAGDLHYQTTDHIFGLDSLTTSEGSDMFVARMSPDADSDSITNSRDNCPAMYNPNQEDYDGDQTGDLCDSDDDNDGILDMVDFCEMGELNWTSNSTSDHDTDGCLDASEDLDDDDDSVSDSVDACPRGDLNWTSIPAPVTTRTDYDSDGCQDITEDTDDDNDLVNDTNDSCPTGQLGWISTSLTDIDGDGCLDSSEDHDDDGDGVFDVQDACPSGSLGWASNSTTDNDGDGCHDGLEDDNDDNDDFLDIDDLCPNGTVDWRSGRYTDYDGDGCQDAGEDTDDDDDGVPDVNDNCPTSIPGWRTNPTVDLDGDGCHDWNEDWDDDGDGVGDLYDLCERTTLGEVVDSSGCASGETPANSGSSSVQNNYQNTTYVNNTYQNDTYFNSTYLNETNEYENNTYDYDNYTYEYDNTTYENTTYENETFQNTTNIVDNASENQDMNGEITDPDDSLSSENDDTSINFIEIAVVLLLVAILLVQLMATKPKSNIIQNSIGGGYQEMAQEEFDQIQEDFDTKSYDEFSPVQQSEDHLNPTLDDSMEVNVEEKTTESTNEPSLEESQEKNLPDEGLEGNVDENGYEWLEYPENSGKNYYRIKGESNQWVEWITSENSS